ncbi:hypothetical protein HaLaN_07822 [Haematococcus lacustris]|uniref:Uncharacterized protein n=1 Tax=Haematococcus lacustris TaxID=44745 RepID=A0A699YZK0_HAELA|nr:hypothetical protein HaLaN_07822 [Haematococcus lacustris]
MAQDTAEPGAIVTTRATAPAPNAPKTCTAQQQPRLAKEPWCKPRATRRCAPCSKGSTLRWSPAWMNTTRPAQATV